MQHIAAHYEALQPLLQSLVKAYPDFVKPATVSWEPFQWAIALWYSYAMEVSRTLVHGRTDADAMHAQSRT